MKTVYLSLGSNVGDRERHLQAAIDRLHAPDFRVRRLSPVYETEPMDRPNQPWFLNLALEAEAGLFPRVLLGRIRKIERELGRRRATPKGPRTIDIDILLFGRFVLHTPELVIPHPRLHERRFVLEPLADLAPDLRHPVLGVTMRELLSATMHQAARRIEFTPRVGPLAP